LLKDEHAKGRNKAGSNLFVIVTYSKSAAVPRFGQNSTSADSSDGIFDAVTVLTDHKTKS